jgi:hypothetical protein
LNRLCNLKNFKSHEFIAFSYTLDGAGRIAIGLKLFASLLSPVLYNGIILLIFNSSGKIPFSKLSFINEAKNGAISDLNCFKSTGEMLSMSSVLELASDFIIFSTSAIVTGSRKKELSFFTISLIN